MSYQRMTLVERMDIFRLLYVERLKPSAIAAALNRQPSSITRELERGMDKGMYTALGMRISSSGRYKNIGEQLEVL